jgi:hypothetical protein
VVPVVLVVVLLRSSSWTSGHPCCSPFPPREQLVTTMVGGATAGRRRDLRLCRHPRSPSSSVAPVVHPVNSCSQWRVWVLGHPWGLGVVLSSSCLLSSSSLLSFMSIVPIVPVPIVVVDLFLVVGLHPLVPVVVVSSSSFLSLSVSVSSRPIVVVAPLPCRRCTLCLHRATLLGSTPRAAACGSGGLAGGCWWPSLSSLPRHPSLSLSLPRCPHHRPSSRCVAVLIRYPPCKRILTVVAWLWVSSWRRLMVNIIDRT